MIAIADNAQLLGYEKLSSYAEVTHFVTTRHGGCSVGSYSSLNCCPYSGDVLGRVKRNQEILCELLTHRPDKLVIPFQIHHTRVANIDDHYASLTPANKELYEHGVDALITDKPGFCICISTADCVPILLYDPKNKAAAAIHAGWRGALSRIVQSTILVMTGKYGTQGADLIACIGPCISCEAFEVGEEVYEAFSEKGFSMSFIANRNQKTGKWHIDLPEAIRLQLTTLGVKEENIEMAGICTHTNHDMFFSARRLGINSGRNLSGIMINRMS